MDQLIVKSLQGTTTPEEEEWLRRWRAEAPENNNRYRQARALWDLVGVGDMPPDVEMVLRASVSEFEVPDSGSDSAPATTPADLVQARDSRSRRKTVPDRGAHRWWMSAWALGAAAAALVVVSVGLADLGQPSEASGPFAESEVVTGAGEMTTVTLRDGSSIRVGPSSRLNLAEDTDGIVARLSGRAFFAVHANPARRFRVMADKGAATVYGTRFEVRSEEEEFRVMVVDGRVRVSTPEGSEVDLLESEMSLTEGDGPPTKSTVSDVYEQLAWMGNALVFQGTSLQRAAEEIERHFGVTVVLEAPELSGTTLSVTFTDEELDDVIMVVCEIVGALCLIEDDRIRVLEDVPATRIRTS
jgi:transmembrane sensor